MNEKILQMAKYKKLVALCMTESRISFENESKNAIKNEFIFTNRYERKFVLHNKEKTNIGYIRI